MINNKFPADFWSRSKKNSPLDPTILTVLVQNKIFLTGQSK